MSADSFFFIILLKWTADGQPARPCPKRTAFPLRRSFHFKLIIPSKRNAFFMNAPSASRDRKSTLLNSSHNNQSRMPSSA